MASGSRAAETSGWEEKAQLCSLSAVTWAAEASLCVTWQELITIYGIYGATICPLLAWYAPGQ